MKTSSLAFMAMLSSVVFGSAQAQPASGASAQPDHHGSTARKPASHKHLTTSDTAMDTGEGRSAATATGPETTTPDAQGTSDLTGSTGASIPLGAAPAPPAPAPPGGAPSGGYGSGADGPHDTLKR